MTLFSTLAFTGQAHFDAQQANPNDQGHMFLYNRDLARMRATPARSSEFLWGRKAAADALAAAGCVNAASLYIGRDSFGAPQWPTGWIGSITHSKGSYVAIAARADDYLSIGVDIEMFRGGEMDRAIGRICLVDADDKSTYPTLIFSAKEAIYKACHPLIGGNLWFTDFTVSHVDPDGTFTWHFNLNPNVNGKGFYQITESGVLTCVALEHDHALAKSAPNTILLTQKEIA